MPRRGNFGKLQAKTLASDAKKGQFRQTHRESDLSDAKKGEVRQAQAKTPASDANAVMIRRLGLITQLEQYLQRAETSILRQKLSKTA